MEIRAYQDPTDRDRAQAATITISDGDGFRVGHYVLNGNDILLAVRMAPSLYGVGCYTVHSSFDTSRPDNQEAYDARDFCIVSGQGNGGAPPLATGVMGKVFYDVNGNGVLDPDEPGMAGVAVVTVNVADFADTARTSTGADGRYSVPLDAGAYLVQVKGTDSHAYVTVADGQATVQDLGGPSSGSHGTVTRNIDGNTIEVSGDVIRSPFVWVEDSGNTAMPHAQYARQVCPVGAAAYYDVDDLQPVGKYGRTIAMVWCGGNEKSLDQLMVESGLGWINGHFCERSEFRTMDWVDDCKGAR